MRIRFPSKILLLLLLLRAPLLAETNPYGIPDPIDENLHKVFTAVFEMKFDDAQKTFLEIKRYKGKHPMVALAAVVMAWWDVSVKVLETDEKASESFLNASEECMEFSERMIAEDDKKGEALVALGTTLGLMSRWSAANRAWIPAYTRGSRAFRYSEKALRRNPKATDVYMTMGTFNYARDVLRASVSGEKSTKASGPSLGIAQLKKARHDAVYFKQASSLLLAGILTNERPKDALPILKELKQEMPDNGFVEMVLITALYNAGDIDTMKTEVTEFSNNVSTNPALTWFVPQAHFANGLVAFRAQDWKAAAAAFGDAADIKDDSNPYVTWAHLYQGYALDAAGERRKAKRQYENVLKLRRRFASHDHARDHLSKPFQPTDVEMKKLEL